jgi:Fe2+ transport system protein FeoA
MVTKISNLEDAPSNLTLKIIDIESGSETKRRLHSMGLYVDDSLLKVNDAKHGPILIQNTGSRTSKVALARSLAEKITVEYDN